ncbi:mucin-2-like [Mya arenaria]|uniref:mucin-2-like n=1 Tax=Mya arenaria TaxID=6604 RepID=UPI0022E553DE|nr:mucin-2-like [Mya arenaria]
MFVNIWLLVLSLLLLMNLNKAIWSSWINRDGPDSGDGDRENWTPEEKSAFCPNGNISRIECYTTDDIASYSSGDIMQCTLSGSSCLNDDNFPVPCSDYKIRYLCELPSTFSAATMEPTTINNYTATDFSILKLSEIQTFSALSLSTIGGSNATDHQTQLPTIGGSNATDHQTQLPSIGGSNATAHQTQLPSIGGSNATDHQTQLPIIGGSNATDNQKHNQPETKMSKSLLIGIVAGCISAVILLTAVAFCVYLSCCRKGKRKEGSVVSPIEA